MDDNTITHMEMETNSFSKDGDGNEFSCGMPWPLSVVLDRRVPTAEAKTRKEKRTAPHTEPRKSLSPRVIGDGRSCACLATACRGSFFDGHAPTPGAITSIDAGTNGSARLSVCAV